MLNTLYGWGGANRELFLAINGFRGPVVDTLMLAGSHLGDTINAAWIALALVSLLAARRIAPQALARFPDERTLTSLLITFALGFAVGASLVIVAKTGFAMPRPFEALPPGSVALLANLREPYSLPSGHAALAMLIAWTLWPHCARRWRLLLALCVLWVGLARISLGAHFPADVVAGYLCGALSGWLAMRIRPRPRPSR